MPDRVIANAKAILHDPDLPDLRDRGGGNGRLPHPAQIANAKVLNVPKHASILPSITSVTCRGGRTDLSSLISMHSVPGPDGGIHATRALVARVGEIAVLHVRKILRTAGLVTAVLLAGLRWGNWPRTTRNSLARQIISSGVEAIGVTCFLALSLGVLLVVQYNAWIGRVVQSRLLAPVVVVVVVRELGPLLVNLIVIARSGSAVAMELGLMHVTGEIRVLEGLGVDPLLYLVVPRVFGLIVSVCCLTLIFMTIAFMGVFFCGQWIGAKTGTLGEFVEGALGLISFADVINVLLKCTLPPLLGGSICCWEGLSAGDTPSEVPRASRIAVQRSVVLLFIVSALISVVTYL